MIVVYLCGVQVPLRMTCACLLVHIRNLPHGARAGAKTLFIAQGVDYWVLQFCEDVITQLNPAPSVRTRARTHRAQLHKTRLHM